MIKITDSLIDLQSVIPISYKHIKNINGLSESLLQLYILFLYTLYRFDPPGQMSAGLTCEMMVTFKPMVNIMLS